MKRIFIRSVQKEFQAESRAFKTFIEGNTQLRHFDVFCSKTHHLPTGKSAISSRTKRTDVLFTLASSATNTPVTKPVTTPAQTRHKPANPDMGGRRAPGVFGPPREGIPDGSPFSNRQRNNRKTTPCHEKD